MKNQNDQHQNCYPKRKRKKKLPLACFYFVLLVSLVTACGAAFDNMTRIEHNTGKSQIIPKIKYEKKNENNIEFKQKNESTIITEPEENKNNTSISDKSEWNLIIVNPWNKLPDDFSVELTTLKNGHSIDERAYPDLQEMMDAARAEGLSPIICSSFRTTKKQQALFDNQVKGLLSQGYSQEDAEKEASKWVAVPGTSEHQTGLAVDIVASSYQVLDEKQADTKEQKWLMENSYKYGFILRYSSDKSDITGISYEPWHYRYVGKEAAKEINEQNICLEEYMSEQSR